MDTAILNPGSDDPGPFSFIRGNLVFARTALLAALDFFCLGEESIYVSALFMMHIVYMSG
ncbi:hypothetical protein GCM10020331_091930 [Ectobacillus funiculus]